MWLPYWRPNSIASSTGLTASSSIVIQSCVVDQAQYDIGRRAKSMPHPAIQAKSRSAKSRSLRANVT